MKTKYSKILPIGFPPSSEDCPVWSFAFCFLIISSKKAIKRRAESGDNLDERQKSENILFRKDENNEDLLNVHLDDRFPNQSSAEKCPKWHEEMAARDSGKIEKRIWDRRGCENAEETNFLDQIVHENLSAGHYVQILAFGSFLLHDLLELFQIFIVFVFFAGETGGSSHKIRRQLSESSSSAPAESRKSDLCHNIENRYVSWSSSFLATQVIGIFGVDEIYRAAVVCF